LNNARGEEEGGGEEEEEEEAHSAATRFLTLSLSFILSFLFF